MKRLNSLKNISQLELELERPMELDRNAHLGGKSFYFFDFDDNIVFLSTPIIIFHKDTGEELEISSSEYAKHHRTIGMPGPYQDYFANYVDDEGSFRNFRDQDLGHFEKNCG